MQNGTILQYFHYYYPADGSLWKKVSEEAKKLTEMGVTALWLPPAYKGASGKDSVGYDTYDLYDLGEFDQKNSVRTRYGTRDEFLKAVEDAQNQGLLIYADIVLNHKGGGDEKEKVIVKRVNAEDRNEVQGDEFTIEAYTKFTFPGRKGKYSDFIWNSECFSGVDFAADLQENSIFKILNSYGDTWEDGVDGEKGNYDYLMYNDIEFRNNVVREELKKWGIWFWKLTKVAGFRLDAVKHIDYKFYNEWLDIVRHETKENLFAVGEYWSPNDLPALLKYIDNTHGRMSLFDAPLHQRFHNASEAGKDFDLRTMFDDTLTKANPGLSVTVVENHDTQPLQALEAPVATWFKPLAYAFILLREAGYPCVFYPDIYGVAYTDLDGEGNERKIDIAACPHLETLICMRKERAYGSQRDYFDHPNLIGWTREGDDEHKGSGCAVTLSNADGGKKWMEVGKKFANKDFSDALGVSKETVKINADGWGEFPVTAGDVSVWIAKH